MKGIPMSTITRLLLVLAVGLGWSARGQWSSSSQKWHIRMDIGGTIPEDADLSKLDGPVTAGGELKLSPGFQFDAAIGYRFTPWLALEGELGFGYFDVDSVGDWSYPDSSLNQLTLMMNIVLEYPRGPLVPFAGLGAGGVYSTLSFGNYYWYYYSDADGVGSDFVPALQAFAGLRYEFNDNLSLGVVYRFLVTDRQEWDIDWWSGPDFDVAVDSIRTHSICLVLTAKF